MIQQTEPAGLLPETSVAELLTRLNLTLAVAESCTGGLIGHRLTEVSGSSQFFMGGVIAYSYEAKEKLLGVDHETLVAYGAVSAEVAVQMAIGTRNLFKTDYALSVTGIAGPGGGLPDKPVGLTYIALTGPHGTLWEQYIWPGSRSRNKQHSAESALNLLVQLLKETVNKEVVGNEIPAIS